MYNIHLSLLLCVAKRMDGLYITPPHPWSSARKGRKRTHLFFIGPTNNQYIYGTREKAVEMEGGNPNKN